MRTATGPSSVAFQFQLQPDQNWFALSRSGRNSRFYMTFAPLQRYFANNSSQAPSGSVSTGLMNTRLATGQHSKINDWIINFEYPRLPDTIKLTKEFHGEVALHDTATAYAAWLEGKQGWPSDEVVEADVNTAIQLVESGKARIWCGNISNIFMAVSQQAGLMTRPLTLMNVDGGNVSTSGHVANETYRPSLARWQLMDFTLGIYSVSGSNGILNGVEFHQIMSFSGPELSGLRFEFYDPSIHRFKTTTWLQLPEQTRTMLQSFYGSGAQLLFRFHPNVGVEKRTFLVRASNRLFDREQMIVYSPNTEALSAVTWYSVHINSRRLCLGSVFLLLMVGILAVRRTRSTRKLSRVHATAATVAVRSAPVLPSPGVADPRSEPRFPSSH